MREVRVSLRLPARQGTVPMVRIKRGAALMTTDNRTNEPTPEQVEVAAVASINSHRSRAGLPTLATQGTGEGHIERAFMRWRDSEIDATGAIPEGYPMFRAGFERAAAASRGEHDHILDGSSYLDCSGCALAAPAGAASQAPKDIHEPNHDRVYCVRCGGNWPCQPSPAPPSSAVDEDALAEVIGKARTTSVRDDDGVKSIVMESNEQIARAVAEWLKGQGR